VHLRQDGTDSKEAKERARVRTRASAGNTEVSRLSPRIRRRGRLRVNVTDRVT